MSFSLTTRAGVPESPALYVLSEPTGPLPITRDEVRGFLRIDHTAEDDLLDLLILGATEFAEKRMGRDLRTRTWLALFDCFQDRMILKRSLVDAITSITYFDSVPSEQTVAATVYFLKKHILQSEIVLRYDDQSWPTDLDESQEEQRITVTFTTSLPDRMADIKVALLNLVGWMYRSRSGACDTLEDATVLASQGPLSLNSIPRI